VGVNMKEGGGRGDKEGGLGERMSRVKRDDNVILHGRQGSSLSSIIYGLFSDWCSLQRSMLKR